MTDSLGGRLRVVLTLSNPVIPVTAVVLALPAAYVVAAAGTGALGFFALVLVGVRVPWLADPDVDGTDAEPAAGDSTGVSRPRAVLWTASTAVLAAAALLGLYTAGVALGVSARAAGAVAFLAAWLLVEPVVGGLGR